MPSYEKRANGWTVRFREMVEGREVNKRLSGYRTKAEAEKAYKSYLIDYDHHIVNVAEAPTLFEELVLLYTEYTKGRTKESSYYCILSKINSHIRDYFGQMKISSITPATILAWQNTLQRYSFKYRSSLNGLLGSIFKFGNRYYNTENPTLKVEPLRDLDPKKEVQVWTPDDFARYLAVVDIPTYRLLFRFLYVSGCRKGEALALSFDDIDLEKGTVRINKSLTRKTSGKPYAITTPKNKFSNRTIEMPQGLLAELLETKKSNEDLFVFGGSTPIAENTLTRKHNKWCQVSGVPHIRIHDLRHSCASYLISQGISIVAVSKRLGHASISQTLDTYCHMMPSDADRIKEIFKNY